MLVILACVPEWADTPVVPRASLQVGMSLWNFDEHRWVSDATPEALQTAPFRPRMARSQSPLHRSFFRLLVPQFAYPNSEAHASADKPWGGYFAVIHPPAGAPSVSDATRERIRNPLGTVAPWGGFVADMTSLEP